MILSCTVTFPLPSRYRSVTFPLPSRYLPVTSPLPSRYLPVTVALPSRYRFRPTLRNVTYRDRYWPLPNVNVTCVTIVTDH